MNNVVAKGTVYMMLGQLSIILSGYLIHVVLARLFGPSVYGSFGVILSLTIITKTVFLTGIHRAVAKYIAEQRERTAAILKAGMQVQSVIIVVAMLLVVVFAAPIASFLNDSSLVSLIRLSSLVVLTVGLFAMYVRGYLDGNRMYSREATMDMIHGALKVVIAILLVWLGFGIFGALLGYILAPLAAFLIARRYVPKARPGENFSRMALIRFALPITFFHITSTLTMNLGLLLVKRMVNEDVQIGIYTAADTLSRIPNSIFIALAMTLFASVSMAVAQKNQELVKKYIRLSYRYSLLLLLPAAALASVYATPIMTLLYSAEYASAGELLGPLIFASVFFSLFQIASSIISASGKPQHAMWMSSLVLVGGYVLYLLLIPRHGLQGAALAMLIIAVAGFMIAALYLLICFKALVRLSSLAKISFATFLVTVLAYFLPASGIMALLFAGLLFLLYLLVLVMLNELTPEDFLLVRSMVSEKIFRKNHS